MGKYIQQKKPNSVSQKVVIELSLNNTSITLNSTKNITAK